MIAALAALLVAAAPATARVAWAQDTAAAEAAHRAAVLAQLPPAAAQRLFGLETTPAAGPPEAIGSYARGCLEGAVALPAEGPSWAVMRPSRNRAWGHPALIAFIERLAALARAEDDWPGLLVGDIAQPRGGPMLTGHGSHQIGLDADIWLTPMPGRRLTRAERDTMPALDVVAATGDRVDARVWRAVDFRLLRTVAEQPQVARIFVNPAIKRALCRQATGDRAWLRKIRPWWGHRRHFHIRLACPAGDRECRDQAPPPPGDGCGRDLAWWFTPAARPHPPAPPRPIALSALPAACTSLLAGTVARPPDQALVRARRAAPVGLTTARSRP